MRILFALTAAIILAGCTSYSEQDKESFDKKIEAFIQKEKIKADKSSSGVYFSILEKGEGPAVKYTDKIAVTYRGTLLNGRVFDERKEPISFNLRNLIPAWKEILPGQNVGSKVLLICPPEMGYGSDEQEKIPANSILVFEINLLSIE